MHRSEGDATQSSSNVNIRFLSTPQKKSRILSNKERAVTAEKEVSKLRTKISQLTEMYGERLSDSLHKDMLDVMNDGS